jgi:hypothetical protein
LVDADVSEKHTVSIFQAREIEGLYRNRRAKTDRRNIWPGYGAYI